MSMRYLFRRRCHVCDGKRDGCPACVGGVIEGLLPLLWRRLRCWFRRSWQRRRPPALPLPHRPVPKLPEPPVPVEIATALTCARADHPGIQFRAYYLPDHDGWAIRAWLKEGRRTDSDPYRTISRQLLNLPPDQTFQATFLIEQECRAMAAALPAPRNVPIPCHNQGPMNTWLREMEAKHRPDGLAGDDTDETF